MGKLPSAWIHELHRNPLDLSLTRAKAYTAPLMPTVYTKLVQTFVCRPGSTVPDFWVIGDVPMVSERAMKAIQEVDEFHHQFVPLGIRTPNGDRIGQGSYYTFNVRRRVDIERTEPSLDLVNFRFGLMPTEGQCMTTVLQTTGLRDALSRLPIWSFPRSDSIYLNEAAVAHFRGAGLTGLVPRSSFLGEPLESLCTVALAA
jgi:hypothetical protein